jgi:hypothetical protein
MESRVVTSGAGSSCRYVGSDYIIVPRLKENLLQLSFILCSFANIEVVLTSIIYSVTNLGENINYSLVDVTLQQSNKNTCGTVMPIAKNNNDSNLNMFIHSRQPALNESAGQPREFPNAKPYKTHRSRLCVSLGDGVVNVEHNAWFLKTFKIQ